MKYNGISFEGPREEILVIPRNGHNIVFKARSIHDFSEFEKLVPEPKAPMGMRPGEKPELDYDNKDYRKKMLDYYNLLQNWRNIKSLEATEELEWETIDLSDPSTWNNYDTELKEAGFSQLEINNIFRTVERACGLDQEKIDEATKSFLAGQAMLKVSSSQNTEP